MNTKTEHRDFIWYILKQREKKNEVSDNEVIMNAALFMLVLVRRPELVPVTDKRSVSLEVRQPPLNFAA
jgi:hypothetical protein